MPMHLLPTFVIKKVRKVSHQADQKHLSSAVTVEPLAHHRDLLPLLAEWFVSKWPSWYGPKGEADNHTPSSRMKLTP